MTRAKRLSGARLLFAAIGLAAVSAISQEAYGQASYPCQPGYYWDPNYGCLPLSYFYGPPTYVYPDFGFGFFYGGGWGGRPGYGYGRGRGPGVGRGGGHPGGRGGGRR